jgi:hypothetical protein
VAGAHIVKPFGHILLRLYAAMVLQTDRMKRLVQVPHIPLRGEQFFRQRTHVVLLILEWNKSDTTGYKYL